MNRNVKQILLPSIVALIWGGAFIVQGSVADKMGAFTFNAVRSYFAVVVLTLASFVADKVRTSKGVEIKTHSVRSLIIGGILCGIAICAASNVQQFGMFGTTDAGGNVLTEGDAAFITALYIVLVPIILLFFGRKPTANVWIAIAMALIGLFLICNFTGGKSFSVYHVELFGCAIIFSVHILLVDHFVKKVDPLKLSCLQFFVMGTVSLIFALIFDDISFAVIAECLPQLIYVGVFSCAIAYTLQIVSQKGTNPVVVSIVLSLESFFALLCEVVLGLITGYVKPHTPLQILGCVIMLLAIVFAQVNVFSYISKKKNDETK